MIEGAWIGFGAALLGAAVGALGSIYATTLRLKGREDYFDRAAKNFFKSKFKNKNTLPWAELEKFGKAIGLTPLETKQILLLAGIEPTDSSAEAYRLAD